MSKEDILQRKRKNIEISVYAFFNHPSMTMIELSELTNISKSSIQRYLNDPYVSELVGNKIAHEIHSRLEINKRIGNQLGGIHFAEQNMQSFRDENGKFISPNVDVVEEQRGKRR